MDKASVNKVAKFCFFLKKALFSQFVETTTGIIKSYKVNQSLKRL